MGHKFSNGKHPYKGKTNGSGKRKQSKIYKGMKFSKKEKKNLANAFEKIEDELYEDSSRRIRK